MHDWLDIGLIALGLGLVASGLLKRRTRMRTLVPASAIRPEFAAMGAMIRPLVLFAVGLFALKLTLFYFVFGGWSYLTPTDFAGILFVFAGYAVYLVLATTKPAMQAAVEQVDTGIRSPA